MVNEAVVPIPTFNSCLFLKFSVVCWKELDKSLLSLCLAYAMLSSTETTFDGLSTWYVQIYRGQKNRNSIKLTVAMNWSACLYLCFFLQQLCCLHKHTCLIQNYDRKKLFFKSLIKLNNQIGWYLLHNPLLIRVINILLSIWLHYCQK